MRLDLGLQSLLRNTIKNILAEQARMVLLSESFEPCFSRADSRILPCPLKNIAIRRLKNSVSARLENSAYFGHRTAIILHMLKHMIGDQQVKITIRIWQGQQINLDHV